MILGGFPEKADARKDAIHRSLELLFFRVGKHERPAASHQVDIVLLSVGYRVIHDCPVLSDSLKIGERQDAVCVGQQSLHCHSVQVFNRRHRNTLSAALIHRKKEARYLADT